MWELHWAVVILTVLENINAFIYFSINAYVVAVIFFVLYSLQRLVVCLEESLYIHNIRDMKVLHTIRETPPNKSGLCALSIDSDNCFLAYPGHSSVGELQVKKDHATQHTFKS